MSLLGLLWRPRLKTAFSGFMWVSLSYFITNRESTLFGAMWVMAFYPRITGMNSWVCTMQYRLTLHELSFEPLSYVHQCSSMSATSLGYIPPISPIKPNSAKTPYSMYEITHTGLHICGGAAGTNWLLSVGWILLNRQLTPSFYRAMNNAEILLFLVAYYRVTSWTE